MRQVVLDTETTGLEPQLGHRLVEIGCVELDGRALGAAQFHHYVNPERSSDPDAYQVHQLSDDFLRTQVKFHEIARNFVDFVRGAELLIHNAPFDVAFVNAELVRASKALGQNLGKLEDFCQITDTLTLAKRRFPGQRNSLDALCKRLDVDSSQRTAHGALLDAKLLAEVYLGMTRGQNSLSFGDDVMPGQERASANARIAPFVGRVLRILPSAEDIELHQVRLNELDKACKGNAAWRGIASTN